MTRHPERLIVPFVTGDLSPTERTTIDAHLAACDECRRAVEETRALLVRLGAGIPAPPPVSWGPYAAELRARRDAGDGRDRGPLARPVPLVLSTALAAALLLMTLVPGRQEPSLEPLAPDEAVIARRLDLLRQYPVVERLDLLEDLDVIRQLDALPVREG